MLAIIGVVVVFVMVFGGYLAAGGKLGIILKALPFEMVMIMGAAIGAFLLANDGSVVKHTLKDIGKIFKGPKWKADDYRDLLCLLFELIRLGKGDPLAVEMHIENPVESTIFGKYPRIQADHEAVELICDTMRSASMNYDDPHQVEEVLDKRMEAHLHSALHSSHALQTMADGLPALGIAGSEDGSTPPDLVRELMDLIPASKFKLIRRAGHLPCVEQPQEYAETLNDFLASVGHIPKAQG